MEEERLLNDLKPLGWREVKSGQPRDVIVLINDQYHTPLVIPLHNLSGDLAAKLAADLVLIGAWEAAKVLFRHHAKLQCGYPVRSGVFQHLAGRLPAVRHHQHVRPAGSIALTGLSLPAAV